MESKHVDLTFGLKCAHRVSIDPGYDHDLGFVRYDICYISAINGLLPWREKQTKCDHWGLTLAMTLTLNFQVQIWNLICLSQIAKKQKSNILIQL